MTEQQPIRPLSIQAAKFEPPRHPSHRPTLPGLTFWLLPLAGVALASALWFVFTLRAAPITITPEPDVMHVSGLTINWGQRLLARPGDYMLQAQKQGYAPLEETIHIPPEGDTRLAFELQPLPGQVRINSTPAAAEVTINDETVGHTPVPELLLEKGEYQLRINANGYQTHAQTLNVTGLGKEQTLNIELLPKAPVSFSSIPAGADIRINGQTLGTTDSTIGLDRGTHQVSLAKAGFRTWSSTIEISASETLAVPTVELQTAAASLRISSEPSGARVTLNGRDRGRTPLTIEVQPDEPLNLQLNHPGFQTLRRTLQVQANTEQSMKGILIPILGEVLVRANPPDAHVFINGEDLGVAAQVLRLPAVETELVFRRPGYIDARRRITPNPELRQQLQVQLESTAPQTQQKTKEIIRTADNQRMRLIQPGRFLMGAPPGQQGRRANEAQRQVELTRPFYIATREVSNASFRRFRKSHSSGVAGDKTLDNDKQPAVQVSWQQAAAYCNWLSKRDGLPPAYEDTGNELKLMRPLSTGYRLPSEAEWAYAARFAGSRDLKFPWGQSMPPTEPVGNFADLRARGLLPAILPNYDDGWAAAAPVAALTPNALGLYDMGGNVSEWVNDFYSDGLDAGLSLERNPLGPASGHSHTVRGSSWRHADITQLRLSWRDEASAGRDDLGFRIVRYAE